MSNDDVLLDYTRQDLRKATKFVEGDYSGINPRQFYRTLKRSIEELQEGNDFKYQTYGGQDSNLEIVSEDVGQKTGTVKGRLFAESDWFDIGTGSIEYRPYGPHGALAIVLGLIFLFLGLSSLEIALLGIALLGAGTYGYLQKEEGEFPIIRQDVIRALITGEVSERTVDNDAERRTDIFANMSVVYAGDAFVAVETNNLDELNWNLRRELTNQVRRWHNQVVETQDEEVSVDDGFLWHLKSWANRSAEEDRRAIEVIQGSLLDGAFEHRLDYTNMLENQLSDEMQEQLAEHEEELMIELEELADDLDIYVEREGLQHTNRIENRQRDASQLESGSQESR